MSRKCTRDDVDELLARIEHTDGWTVDDWDLTVGRSEDGTVEVTVAWNPSLPPQSKRTIKDVIDYHTDGHNDGAPIEDVLADLDHMDDAEEAIEKLRTMGEVYEPVDGFVRTT